MNKEEIQDILEELHLVRPEILQPKAKKLFEAIMSIADERDELLQRNSKAIEYIEHHTNDTVECLYVFEVKELLEILKGDNND